MPWSAEGFASYDALLVSTTHSQFRDPTLYKDVKLAIDTRNIVPHLDSMRVERA